MAAITSGIDVNPSLTFSYPDSLKLSEPSFLACTLIASSSTSSPERTIICLKSFVKYKASCIASLPLKPD